MGSASGAERRFRLMAVASLGLHLSLVAGFVGREVAARAVSSAPSPSGDLPLAEFALELDEPFDEARGALEASSSALVGGSRADLPSSAAPHAGAPSPAATPGGAASSGELDVESTDVAGDAEPSSAEGAAAEGLTSPARPRRLSLDQLGVGRAVRIPEGSARPDARRGSADRRASFDASQRLQTHLSRELVRSDVAKGLGPEGPVVTQVLAAAHRGTVPFDARARLAVTADEQGRVLSVRVVSSDGATAEWDQLAREVFASLADKRLRVLGGRGYRFTLRVESRNQLPSGADPGLGVNVLGADVKQGKGSRSSSVRLLDPTTGTLLGVNGDLSDLGQVARRVVHAHLEALELGGERAAETP